MVFLSSTEPIPWMHLNMNIRPRGPRLLKRRLKINLATFKLLTFPSLRLVAKVPFAAAPAACSWSTFDPTRDA
jgi:hypothetical protein